MYCNDNITMYRLNFLMSYLWSRKRIPRFVLFRSNLKKKKKKQLLQIMFSCMTGMHIIMLGSMNCFAENKSQTQVKFNFENF